MPVHDFVYTSSNANAVEDPTYLQIFLAVFAVLFFGSLAMGLRESLYNKRQPVVTQRVKITSKRFEVRGTYAISNKRSSHWSHSYYYYLTFEFEDGNRL